VAVTNYSIIPLEVRGWVNDIIDQDTDWHFWYPWLKNLKNTQTFVHLSAGWSKDKSWPMQPDPGYDQYILSGDAGLPGWAEHVANLYDRPVFAIDLPEVYQESQHKLVHCIPNIYYHKQIEIYKPYITATTAKEIIYKASALTSRISQSKIIVFSALKKFLKDSCFYSLHNRVELENVHYWQATQNKHLDDLTRHFQQHWIGQEITIPNDTGDQLSAQNPAYTQSALNFTQESFHYSYMYDAEKNYSEILSGPFITEKTFKCLLSQTAFIPVGQFRTYEWFKLAGFKFDYGIDLSFDQDPGNVTRLAKIVDLIQDLSNHSAQDLFEMSRPSGQHNHAMLFSGEFFDFCETSNASNLSLLYEKILG
jgi:hypothetical protein